MNKKIIGAILVIISTFFVVLVYLMSHDQSRVKVVETKKIQQVNTLSAKKIPLKISVHLLGTISPKYKSKLASLTPGYIKQIFVHRGEYVKKNQMLALMDSNVLQFDLDDVNAQLLNIKKRELRESSELEYQKSLLNTQKKILNLKEKNLSRYKKLLDKNIVGQSSYESQEQIVLNERAKVRNLALNIETTEHDLAIFANQKKQMHAKISSLQYKISKLQIKAPYNGFIYSRHVSIGGHVTAGETLFEIYSEEGEIIAPMPYQYTQLILSAYNKKELIQAQLDNGGLLTLDRISNVIKQGRLGRELFFTFKEKRKLIHNSKINLKLLLPSRSVFYVPKSALYEGSKIFIIVNNRLKVLNVNKIGTAKVLGKTVYAIDASNLKTGDKILITPVLRARQGVRVKVKE